MLLIGDCLTMGEPRRAGAVLLRGERIADLGDAATMTARYPAEKSLRVERVTPGVHDAHAHPLLWGQSLVQMDLVGVSDPAKVASRVAERVRELAPGQWVRGRGYLFEEYPDGSLLNQAAPDNPVLLESRDLHSGWASGAALRAAGITRETPDPVGGRILRDVAGEPTGYLLERAVALVGVAVPPPTREDLERGLADFARRGYTAVHAMAYPGFDDLDWLEELARGGSLPLRVWCAIPRERWRDVTPGWRGEELEVAAVKLFADGALGSYTAWMYEPYPDGSHGFPLDDREVMVEEGKAALAAGYTLAIHAIGTRAVAEVLDAAYELAPLARRRLRIEHVQHVRTPEVQAIGELPLGLSLQPIHLRSDADLVRRRLPGQEREAFRLRDLWGTGVPLAFGSDAPVAPPDLAGGLLAATDHPLSPLQSVDEEQALHAFTRGAALVAGWNDYGVLAPGARADLGLWEDGRLVGRVFRGELDG